MNHCKKSKLQKCILTPSIDTYIIKILWLVIPVEVPLDR